MTEPDSELAAVLRRVMTDEEAAVVQRLFPRGNTPIEEIDRLATLCIERGLERLLEEPK
jgi:hypothetical protein